MLRSNDVHLALRDSEFVICPFCDEVEVNKPEKQKRLASCNNSDTLTDKGMKVCRSFDIVSGYVYDNGYIDLHENMYKKKRKSIYNRKYHIKNLLFKLCRRNFADIHSKNKRLAIFKEIDKVLPNINRERKRI